MLKVDEVDDANSCWSKARDDERIFVLLARDLAAPDTIRFWANRRVQLGKNRSSDPQIVAAMTCAELMEQSTQEA